jgi:hypothetical protein
MRLKNPGGELTWLTPLIAIGGIYLGYTSWIGGSTVLAATFASMGICSMLVWFDQKWVAIPLIGYFTFALFAGTVILVTKGFSWQLFVRLLLVAYTIYGFWEWRKRPDDTMSAEYPGVE